MRSVIASVLVSWLMFPSVLSAGNPLVPSYPSIPPTYERLYASKMIADARVDFPAYLIDYTNGYKVTAPSGAEFVVDNIVQPKCAFYGTYVAQDENGHLGIGGGVEVVSNVYIGEVNFEKCQ